MKQIEEALTELKKAIASIDLITLFYNATLIFLVSTFTLLLLGLFWGLAFLPAMIYLFYFGYKKSKGNKLLKAELTTPKLNEKLRTAADNTDKDNELVNALNEEVVRDMKYIETQKFLDYKDLSMKITLIVTVSFFTIILSYLNVGLDLPEFASRVDQPLNEIRERIAGQEIPDINRVAEEGNISNILGDRSLALLGKKEILLEINPLESEVNLEEISEAEGKDFNPPSYPKEIYTSYDIASQERAPKQNSHIIKSYFEQISR